MNPLTQPQRLAIAMLIGVVAAGFVALQAPAAPAAPPPAPEPDLWLRCPDDGALQYINGDSLASALDNGAPSGTYADVPSARAELDRKILDPAACPGGWLVDAALVDPASLTLPRAGFLTLPLTVEETLVQPQTHYTLKLGDVEIISGIQALSVDGAVLPTHSWGGHRQEVLFEVPQEAVQTLGRCMFFEGMQLQPIPSQTAWQPGDPIRDCTQLGQAAAGWERLTVSQSSTTAPVMPQSRIDLYAGDVQILAGVRVLRSGEHTVPDSSSLRTAAHVTLEVPPGANEHTRHCAPDSYRVVVRSLPSADVPNPPTNPDEALVGRCELPSPPPSPPLVRRSTPPTDGVIVY